MFIYFSLAIGTLNMIKLMLCALFSYNMGNKIKRVESSEVVTQTCLFLQGKAFK